MGYVGLPPAVEFGKIRSVIGFDIDPSRIAQLQQSIDRTLRVEPDEFSAATRHTVTSDPTELSKARLYIITVPTPIDAHK